MRIYTFFLFLLLSSIIRGQSIQNTIWKTYNSSFTDTITIVVKTDTFYQYIANDSLLVASIFEQSNDTILLLDVSGPLMCTNPDTGWYKIDISNDTMTVALINDQCIPRGFNYDGAVLWKIKNITAVESTDHRRVDFKIYPNPSNGLVKIETSSRGNLTIYNTSGQELISKEYNEDNSNNTFQLLQGIYLVRFIDDKQGYHTGRVVVE